ncbi:MAG: YdcF family protein [Clostridia bacterium]|nr:YdcF family protein [Clostridia bacterium]
MGKKNKLYIIAGYIGIIIFTVIAILISGRSYTVYLNNPYNSDKATVISSNESVVINSGISRSGDYTRFVFKAINEGKATVTATIYNEANEKESISVHYEFSVLPTGVFYLTGYDYGGWQFTLIGMALMMLYSFIICFVQFERRKKIQFFSYKTVLDFSLIVFFGLQSLMYLGLLGICLILPQRVDSWQIYNLAGFITMLIFFISIPFIVLFAGFLSVSNLSLIKHEGFRKNNLFGILISIALFAGSILCVFVAIRNPYSTHMELTYIRDAIIRTVASSVFVYMECLLLSAMYCTQYAAKHEPKYNQDFIIILGCKIGKDGKPLPLLRGRIDRALEFYHKQLEKTGKNACFIPSGGKGSDEIISEAECMKNYLIEKGIDESIIYPETQSSTTLQNMKFSKKIADEHKENASILFSTTNYHIFRSGMLSAKAGMKAHGIGAKTKWFFWPNAQMREFIGLLASEWKINIALIALIVLLSTLFANITTIINWIVNR